MKKANAALKNKLADIRQFAVASCEEGAAKGTVVLTWKRVVGYNSAYPWVKAALSEVLGITWSLRVLDGLTPPPDKRARVAVSTPVAEQAVAPSAFPAAQEVAGGVDATQRPPRDHSPSRSVGLSQRWLVVKALEQFRSAGAHRTPSEYQLGEVVGEGAFGTVRRAVRLDSRQQVVIKELKISKFGTSKSDYLQEVSILSQLSHENIVVLCDVQGPSSLVFVDAGMAVSRYISETGRSDVSRSAFLMRQGFAAAHYFHALAIVHTDLKPANMCIRDDKRTSVVPCAFGPTRGLRLKLVIVDFGSAIVALPEYRNCRKEQEIAADGLHYGTLWYRPPEVLFGFSGFAQEVDIWALGCVFAELLTAEPPFRGTSQVDMRFKIFSALGAPDPSELAFFASLPLWTLQQPRFPRRSVSEFIKHDGGENVNNLLAQLWAVVPTSRISARAAESVLLTLAGVSAATTSAGSRPLCILPGPAETLHCCRGWCRFWSPVNISRKVFSCGLSCSFSCSVAARVLARL